MVCTFEILQLNTQKPLDMPVKEKIKTNLYKSVLNKTYL